MATFYIQLENKLLQISGELNTENISKALGYVPVSPNVTNELSQRVDNITFDSLKDNPFLQDGSGELNIVDEAGNIIAKIDADGIHSVDFIAGNHKLTDKIDSSALNGYAKESWVTAEITKAATEGKVDLTGYATEEYVNNIDFYNIKDNPIVNNGDGKLLFVDENGYIGLQLEEDGLYVKDVIADGHTLSQKADKSDIPSLDGYATESYVNTNLQNYATKDEVSDLVDMSVVTELQGKVNTLIDTDTNKSVRDIAVDVLTETLVSETATEAYDTLAEMSAWIKSHPEDASAMNTAIQKNTTDITNLDASYKAADAKVLTDAQEYTDNINFYTIKDNPIVDGEAGSITFVDETGYIGLKVTEDGIVAKDFVAGEHKLSEKVDKDEVSQKQDVISDLETIRQGAAKGATALQSYTEQYKGTVTGVKINGTTKNPTSGVVDLGTVITSHQTLKTINGESIVGSGNITISGGSGSSSGSGAYPEVNHGTSDTTFALTPNTFHIWDEVTSLALDLRSETTGVANEYLFQFTSGSEPTSLILPDDIKWTGGDVPAIEANKIYQISILKGLGSVMSWDNSNLIAFSVLWGMSGTLNFECEKGMTWEAFVSSSYNTDSAMRIYNDNILYGTYRIQDVTPTTIIENGKIYTSIYVD